MLFQNYKKKAIFKCSIILHTLFTPKLDLSTSDIFSYFLILSRYSFALSKIKFNENILNTTKLDANPTANTIIPTTSPLSILNLL